MVKPDEERVLSIQEAANALGVSRDTVRRRIKKGEIPAEKISGPYGNMYYIREKDLAYAQHITDVVAVNRELSAEQVRELMEEAVAKQVEARLVSAIQPLVDELRRLHQQGVHDEESVQQRLDALIEEIAELKGVVESKTPWWKRLFNREEKEGGSSE